MSKVENNQSVNTAQFDNAGPVPGQTWTSLPEIPPSQCGIADPVAAALASLAKLADQSRALSRDLKEAQEALRQAQEKKQVDAMRAKADEIRKGAIGQAIALAGSAALHVAAFEASRSAPGAESTNEELAKVRANASPGEARGIYAELGRNRDAARASESSSRLYSGLADVSDKSGALPKATYDARGVDHDADAQLAESRARTAGAKAEQFQDSVDQANEVARKAWDAVRSVHEARHAAQMAIVAMRG